MQKSRDKAIAYVWRYHVKPEAVDAFREAYGPKGVWAAFFSASDAYLGTDLFEDQAQPGHFMTIDYFSSPRARPDLVAQEAARFSEIDQEWEAATLEETYIGEMTAFTPSL